MTEEEKFRNDPDYLRGRIDALTIFIDTLVDILPKSALELLTEALESRALQIVNTRDRDPVHIDWDIWERSHNPKDRPPPITLHAQGFVSCSGPLLDNMERTMELLDQKRFTPILAETKKRI